VDFYQQAGIPDIRTFYHDKFFHPESPSAALGQDLRHSIDHAKVHWILSNVRPGANVLDVGCGPGTLGILVALGCQVTGVDISPLNCGQAVRNGYALAVVGDVAALPFPDASFDAVVSLDVMGHIPFERKDDCVREWSRVLRPGGVQLHGIECDRLDYASLSPEELAAFVQVDGHVGLEGQEENEARFRRHHPFVESHVQFTLVLPVVEIAKQAAYYPQNFRADPYLLNRIRNFDESETAAWNLAMGFAFERITRFRVQARDEWAFLFLRASNAPLSPDRYGQPSLSRLLKPVSVGTLQDRFHVVEGFHAPEGDRTLEGGYRWTSDAASLLVPSAPGYRICLGTTRPQGAGLAVGAVRCGDGPEQPVTTVAERVVVEVPGVAGDAVTPATVHLACTTFNPCTLAISGDDRDLGMRVYWVDWD
jgi:ubiquinone/menaquinone biosynthesis C-methylase UbiE